MSLVKMAKVLVGVGQVAWDMQVVMEAQAITLALMAQVQME